MTELTTRPEHRDCDADPEKRWRRRPEARPEEIMKAALTTFINKGFAGTRLEEVARLAGVSKGTLYLYFSSKEELFKAAVRDSLIPHIHNAEQLVEDFEGSATELLRTVFERWASFLLHEELGGLSKLMTSEAANFPDVAEFYMNEVVLRLRKVFANVITRGINNGEFRQLPVDLMVRELTTPVIFATIWKHSLAPFDPQPLDYAAYLPAHIDLVLRALLKNPGCEEL